MLKRLLPAVLAASTCFAATVTVNPSETKQTVIGFGAGSVYYQNWVANLPSDLQKDFYDTAFTGLNLSLLRLGNWLQEDSKDISDDVAIVKAAKERLGSHLKIEMSSWSAPARLKPSNDVNGKNNGVLYDSSAATLNTSTSDKYGNYAYAEFAAWWKSAYETYQKNGIAPDYISLQNEPDMFADYEETLFEPTETSVKAGYDKALEAVYDAFQSVSNPPKILGPEPIGIGYNNFQNYAKKLDTTKLDGYAYHLYYAGSDNDNAADNYLSPENFRSPMKKIASSYGSDQKPIIMTEFCNMLEKTRESDMVGLAHIMQVGFTDGKLGGYMAWELYWGEEHGQLIGVCPGKGWSGCTEASITINPEYHGMRHYSKFVNPDWKVISTTASESALKTVAFTNAQDSVSVIVINTGSSEITLDAPEISGFGVKTAVQSTENGQKSKSITVAGCFVLPARSITTLVYTKGTSVSESTLCSAETIDEGYVAPIAPSANDTIVIVDYSSTTDVSLWSGNFTVTYGSNAIEGVSGYASVPQAGCNQGNDDCSYAHAIFTIPSSASKALSTCEELVLTMHSMDDTTTYVNVGGIGEEWVSYQYGRQAGASSWVESTVSLADEGDNNSTKLSFNSNGSGFYVSKIIAVGCASGTPVRTVKAFAQNDLNLQATLFDMNGNIVWKGLKKNALNSNGTLGLDVRQGSYILKTKYKTVKAIKK